MTIHTTAPKEPTYVRVSCQSIASSAVKLHGRVGKVISEGAWGEGQTLIIVNIAGETGTQVVDGRDIELIDKKTYFTEALKSG